MSEGIKEGGGPTFGKCGPYFQGEGNLGGKEEGGVRVYIP